MLFVARFPKWQTSEENEVNNFVGKQFYNR